MSQNPRSTKPTSSFLPLVLLSLGLIALAHAGAEVAARWPVLAGPEGGHTVTFYRVIFTIWVTTLLVTPALCSFVLLRPGESGACWRWLWTMAYVAFLSHLYWTVWGTFHGNLAEIFNSNAQTATNPERIVDHPGFDFLLTFWWGLDVALAWLVQRKVRWIGIQRGAVHLFTFSMFFGALLLGSRGTEVARFLGIVLALVVIASFLAAVIFRETDPDSLFSFLLVKTFGFVNSRLGLQWYRLPTWLAIPNIMALREVLRAKNLHDTSRIPVSSEEGVRPFVPYRAEFLTSREPDGFHNDLAKPTMGSASLNPVDPRDTSDFTLSTPGARFGRNIPLSEVIPEERARLVDPNPREISTKLLSRNGDFKPVEQLNLLAAAWIQFQVHDWFNHGNPVKGNEIVVDIPSGDRWHECPMRIRRTRPDPTRVPDDGAGPFTFANAESHWWDGSQIYGSSQEAALEYRTGQGGKLDLDAHELLLVKENGLEKTAFTGNWWIGLSLLHSLFASEHNAICDHLARAYPDWDDHQLYRTARLVNVALMAKIHAVDWSPAILANRPVEIGLRANWFGLATERIHRAFGRISESESISGIPGSGTNQHGADFCLTEEFVSVYRMHPLMPDHLDVFAARDGRWLQRFVLGAEDVNDPRDVVGPRARANALADGTIVMADLVYSFGRAHPGALTLHNYPDWMRRLRRRKSNGDVDETIDLAAIDIVRDRERGVPRYNRFRELLHLPRIKSFEKLTSNPEWAADLERIYGHVDRVDLMVGMFAETPPPGFGFSDTAFRLFILMASRRLKSDRFFTSDYTPEVYSRAGFEWIESNDMGSVLLRHYPLLAPALRGVPNPFFPWNDVQTKPCSPLAVDGHAGRRG